MDAEALSDIKMRGHYSSDHVNLNNRQTLVEFQAIYLTQIYSL